MIEEIFYATIVVGALLALGIGVFAGLVKLAIFAFTWAIH